MNTTIFLRYTRMVAIGATVLCISSLFSACKHDDLPKDVYKVNAKLSGSQEVPPTNSTAKGKLWGTYNSKTNVLKATLSWWGLTGSPSMMHFHGPADVGQNAGVDLGIMGFPVMATGEVSVMDTLTAQQEMNLLGGKWYANIHTKLYPAGEIRGQVSAKH